MQETLYQTAGARDYITQRLQETLYQTAETGVLYQTADASVSIPDNGCRRLYQTVNAGVSISDSGCKRHYTRQRMQETLY